jgi:hypothetical protein
LRNRTLTREQALREYPMYKIRYFEFHNYSNVFIDICEGSFVPINLDDTKYIMRNVQLGLFYSLFDSNPRAITSSICGSRCTQLSRTRSLAFGAR